MPHVVYSMPTVIFDEVAKSPDENAIDFDALNPWDETITLNAVWPAPFDFSQVPSLTFFEVIEAKPENRYHLPLHHLDRWIDSVHAMRRKLIAQDASSGRVILLSKSVAEERLHLRVFVNAVSSFFFCRS